MAAIYDYKNGHLITGGLQGCKVCDEAVQSAIWIAEHRNQPVHLEDDDGDWVVYPDGTMDQIQVQRVEGNDKPGQYWEEEYYY